MTDRRDYMAAFGRLLPEGFKVDRSNPRAIKLTFSFDSGEGDEPKVYSLPCRFEVCGTCDGIGSHVNPSIDAHGITQEEFDDDPQFREDYFSGRYDQTCSECKGERVSPVIDEARADPATLKVLRDWQKEEEDFRSIVESEHRRGC